MHCYVCGNIATLVCPRCGRSTCNVHQSRHFKYDPLKYICSSCFQEVEEEQRRRSAEESRRWQEEEPKRKAEEERRRREEEAATRRRAEEERRWREEEQPRHQAQWLEWKAEEERRKQELKREMEENFKKSKCRYCNGSGWTIFLIVRCDGCNGDGKDHGNYGSSSYDFDDIVK